MNISQFILSFDQGTTSSRAVIFDHKGAIVSIAQKEFKQIYPQPGWVEHDPSEIWSTQLSVAVEAVSKAGKSYGYCGNRHHQPTRNNYCMG